MAVQQVATIHAYEGLSTDVKPTDASVRLGSTFTELDTGLVSLWNGTLWYRQAGAATSLETETGIASILTAMLTELGKIRRMTAIANELDDDELEPDSPMLS